MFAHPNVELVQSESLTSPEPGTNSLSSEVKTWRLMMYPDLKTVFDSFDSFDSGVYRAKRWLHHQS